MGRNRRPTIRSHSIAKWLWLHCLIGAFPAFGFGDDLFPKSIRDFSAGLYTKRDPTLIPDNAAQDLQNVDLEKGTIEKRRGSVKQNTTTLGGFSNQPARFVHEFPDSSGNFWLLSVSSNTLFKSDDGGATNTLLTSTHGITATSQFCGVNAFGKVRLTDGSTDWILFDGITISVSTSSPKGKTCEFFGERVLTSMGSTLYASKNGDPEDWITDTTNDDDAFSTPVRQNDGYDIQCIKRFRYGLLAFKNFSIDLFTLTSDGLTFVRTPLSNTVGTQHCESVVERENDIVWLAHDGFYSFNGTQILKISDPIQPTVDQIQQLNSASRSFSQTSQSEFNTGTLTDTNTTLTPGSVVLSTWTATDTGQADFEAGTLSQVTATEVIGSLYMTRTQTNPNNFGFETGDFTSWTATPPWRIGSIAFSGSFGAIAGNCSDERSSYTFKVLDPNNNVIYTGSTYSPPISGVWSLRGENISSLRGQNVKVQLDAAGSGATLTSDLVYCCFNNNVLWWDRRGTAPCVSNSAVVDQIAGGFVNGITNGNLVSQTFDTAVSSPAWLSTNATFTENSHNISFETQVSTDAATWDSWVSWTPGSAPTSGNKRYIRYRVTLSTATNGTAEPFVDDVTLASRAKTGRYLSPSISMGSAITSWGQFFGVTGGSGNVIFELYTDTNTAMNITNPATFVSSQTVTNGTIPIISTSTFAWISSAFSIAVATENPSIDDFTLNWNEGEGNFPVWAILDESDYIVTVALLNTDRNDAMLLFDQNGAWTKYSYPGYSLTTYRQNPYFGSAIQGDIVQFQVDNTYQDFDGSAIDSYWISKEFDFGLPLTDKTINRFYITAEATGNSEATFEYGMNRGPLTSTTLNLDQDTGFFREVIKPSSLTFKRGLSSRFKISNSILDDYFNILSITIKGRTETSP